jgi:hypothetical protein
VQVFMAAKEIDAAMLKEPKNIGILLLGTQDGLSCDQ